MILTQEADACHAALDMLERVDALNSERELEASASGDRFIPIKIGIGINTGRCTVGNMGSDLRFQYTVMGDTVNVASRLEGSNKGARFVDHHRIENRRCRGGPVRFA